MMVTEEERNLLLRWLKIKAAYPGVWMNGVDLTNAILEAVDILTPGE